LLAIVGCALATATFAVPVSAASTGWTATATRALQVNGAKAGDLAASTPLHIAVALRLHDQAGLDALIRQNAASSDPTFLTPDAFVARFAPTNAEARAVADYLAGQGFTNVAIESNRLLVTADGTALAAEKAFNTDLAAFTVHGATVFANTLAASVPSALGGSVLAVLGLNNIAMQTPQDTVPTYLVSYTPQGFWEAYDVGSTPTGSKTPIAIFAQGDVSGVVKDLRIEEAADHLAQVPVTVVPVGIASPDTAAAGEWDMDTQFAAGMAGNVARLYLYDTTTLTDSDVIREFNAFATQNVARAGSASFGECEYQAWADGAMVAMDQVFAQAAAQGQTVFASSGDTGGFCPVIPDNGVPAGAPDAGYPSSSPYVVSVGGTTLLTNADGSYNNEAGWLAGGGGPSIFESQPYWQQGVTPATGSTCLNYVACVGKNLPDVSLDADPESGANVYVNGSPEGIGGTSLSSPLALGVWARLQSAHANKLGFAAPRFYAVAGGPGYHDVILGNNGPYPATPGWDYATGIGTPDVAKLNAAIVPPTVPAPKLASPACTTWQDGAGDSSPIGSVDNVDSLDLIAGGFAASTGNVKAVLLVKSLSSGPGGQPAVAGGGDVWYATFVVNGVTEFLSAEYPGSTADPTNPAILVDFSYGHIEKSATGGSQYTTDGTATGTFDLAKGVITMSAPASAFGLAATATLSGTGASTFELVGTAASGGALEPADSAGPGASYRLGASC
jgi:subtilase family serine protease